MSWCRGATLDAARATRACREAPSLKRNCAVQKLADNVSEHFDASSLAVYREPWHRLSLDPPANSRWIRFRPDSCMGSFRSESGRGLPAPRLFCGLSATSSWKHPPQSSPLPSATAASEPATWQQQEEAHGESTRLGTTPADQRPPRCRHMPFPGGLHVAVTELVPGQQGRC